MQTFRDRCGMLNHANQNQLSLPVRDEISFVKQGTEGYLIRMYDV
mgnify:FL=1|jgi:hypothetical protein